MPSYCTNCGAPVDGRFCVSCGQPTQAPDRPPATVNPPAEPKPKGAGKPLLILSGLFLALLALSSAGVIYGVYKVKQRAMATLSTYTGGTIGSAARQVKVAHGQTCELLPREDLQEVLGIPIERSTEVMDGSDAGCAYYTNPEAFTELQRMAVEEAQKDSEAAAKQPAPKTDNPLELLKDVNKLEGIVKTFGLTQGEKDGRVFAFTVDRGFGRENWPALRTSLSAVPGFEDVPSVGDHAMIGSFGHSFHVLKGDSMIRLEMIFVPDARMRGAEIGRKIAGRL